VDGPAAGAPYGVGGAGSTAIGIVGIGIPNFLHSCRMRKPATRRKASLLRIRAFRAFTPIRATKIGMRAFSFSFTSSRRGSSSFFFRMPRAETNRN
jgi:hypothetical protein